MDKVFICYQSDTDANILAITDTEEQAKNICNIHGDRYLELKLNENYGRELTSTDNIAVYNIDGKFTKGDIIWQDET